MSERPFLAGYAGQTVEELVALEGSHRIDSLVLAFEEALDQKAAREGLEALSPEELVVLAIEGLEREVNNGGYDQFFVNSTVAFVPAIVDALQRIGCPKTAAITRDAIAALHLPAVTVAEVEKVIYNDDDERAAKLGTCDNRFFEYEENLAEKLFEYIKQNRRRIKF